MAQTRPLPPVRNAPRRARQGLFPLALLVLVVTQTLVEPRRAQAGGLPPAEVVAVVNAAYGTGGQLAVVVARQLTVDRNLSLRAAEVRADRLLAGSADNGQVAQRPFPSASMVKLFLAEEVLRRARTGTVVLSAQDRQQLAAMISSSDDPAASSVWVRFDGPALVRAVALRYDLTGTSPPLRPGKWGQTMTTARDLARFLALLPVLAHPDDAAQLTAWMTATTPIAADGFDQRFGLFGALPGGPAVKQGWMCCVGGSRHLHSVAVVGTRVVVLLSEVPEAVTYDQARSWLTAAGRAVPAPPSGP